MTGIILSGGKSLRMGREKAFIEIEGIPIIERIVSLFKTLFEETMIVTNQPELYQHLDALLFSDLIPEGGALGGLYTGLHFSSFNYSFVVACDMPFLQRPVIEHLVRQADGYDVILPRTEDGLQPLHAVYAKSCLSPIERTILRNQHRITDFYPLVRIKIVEESEFRALDPGRRSFININTREDLQRIQAEMKR